MPSTILNSPFSEKISPGQGEAVISILPPSRPSLSILSYQYPLKLISRIPACNLDSKYPSSATPPVHLYLLSFGGGLLPGDHINVSIKLEPRARVVVTTPQGNTKIYKTEPRGGSKRGKTSNTGGNNKSDRSGQTVRAELSHSSGLCYLPDPSVPYERSRYEQVQQFTILQGEQHHGHDHDHDQNHENVGNTPYLRPSLCVLDWVTEGRSARGEKWAFHTWSGRNEVWVQDRRSGKRRLLLRDTVTLDEEEKGVNINSPQDHRNDGTSSSSLPHQKNITPLSAKPLTIAARTAPHGIIGTLILYGPLFESLASFFMEEFTGQPRIGGRNWSAAASRDEDSDKSNSGEVIWTAAKVRSNFVLVKFGAPDFEAAKDWLGGMFRREGSIEKEFGEEALAYL